MVRRQTRSIARKRLWIGGVAVLVLFIALTGAAKYYKIWPFRTTTTPVTPYSKTSHPSPKNNNVTDKSSLQGNDTQTKTTDQIPVSPDMVATITQLSETSQQVQFAATVTNAAAPAGTCVVTFSTPNDRPVVKQFAAALSGTTAVCGPTSFSTNEFSYLGTWQVQLRYFSGSTQATANGSIDVK